MPSLSFGGGWIAIPFSYTIICTFLAILWRWLDVHTFYAAAGVLQSDIEEVMTEEDAAGC